MPEVKRTCTECRYCYTARMSKYGTWLACKQFDIEVAEDDYCSFGKDIDPYKDDRQDEIYERYKDGANR